MKGASTEIASAVVISHASLREEAFDTARATLRHYGGEFACLFTTREIFLCRPGGRPGGRG